MTATEKLIAAFASALEIEESEVSEQLEYNNNHSWDSTAHMLLIARIEEDFDVLFEVDDIIDMSSFSKARQLIHKCDQSIVF